MNGNRRYYDGREVDKQGKLTAYYKPISGGAPDISPGKGLAILKLLKSLKDCRNAKSAFKLGGQLSTLLKPLGLGSTGRTTAANLTEDLAM